MKKMIMVALVTFAALASDAEWVTMYNTNGTVSVVNVIHSNKVTAATFKKGDVVVTNNCVMTEIVTPMAYNLKKAFTPKIAADLAVAVVTDRTLFDEAIAGSHWYNSDAICEMRDAASAAIEAGTDPAVLADPSVPPAQAMYLGLKRLEYKAKK